MAIDVNIQNPNKTLISLFTHTRFNPADGATYFFGNTSNPSPQTAEDFGSTIIPVDLTIKTLYGVFFGSVASSENVSYYITIDGVDTLIQTVQLTATRTLITNSSLNLAASAGQKLSIKMVCPAIWVTNPINCYGEFNLYCI